MLGTTSADRRKLARPRVQSSTSLRIALPTLAALLVWPTDASAAETKSTTSHANAPSGSPDVFLELHIYPVPELQLAVWVTDDDDNFIQDAFVTQATGKLGIGNRPGYWNFLSSWRAPYGPRRNVLPRWAHERGVTYPEIIFHDERTPDSLGFHEQTSSYESYFCRPLMQSEHDNILDTLTCPSPQVFRSDKGQFSPDGYTSVYPPRNDIAERDARYDASEVADFSDINDLDSVTQSTPRGQTPEIIVIPFDSSLLDNGRGRIWVEANLEADENSKWDYDREDDHFVDSRLDRYGIPFLGQPAISYSVDFDISQPGYTTTNDARGYASWDGSDGKLNDIDSGISRDGGSGIDRLRLFKLPRGGDRIRLAVYNPGTNDSDGTGGGDGGGDGGADGGPDMTGGDGGSGGSGGSDNPGGGGGCRLRDLPAALDFDVKPLSFDSVRVRFTVPEEVGTAIPLNQVHLYYQTPAPEDLDPAIAVEANDVPAICHHYDTYSDEVTCLEVVPGEETEFVIDSLWGNYDYAFGVTYEDRCRNESELSMARVRTPAQEFQTIDTFCFVATAAYGAPWVDEVESLRSFRDVYLKSNPLGRDLVDLYYAYGPALAQFIGSSEYLRSEARSLLLPLVEATRQLPGVSVYRDTEPSLPVSTSPQPATGSTALPNQ